MRGHKGPLHLRDMWSLALADILLSLSPSLSVSVVLCSTFPVSISLILTSPRLGRTVNIATGPVRTDFNMLVLAPKTRCSTQLKIYWAVTVGAKGPVFPLLICPT